MSWITLYTCGFRHKKRQEVTKSILHYYFPHLSERFNHLYSQGSFSFLCNINRKFIFHFKPDSQVLRMRENLRTKYPISKLLLLPPFEMSMLYSIQIHRCIASHTIVIIKRFATEIQIILVHLNKKVDMFSFYYNYS